MTRRLVFYFYLIFLISCQSNIGEQDPGKAKQLFSDGMKILNNRISIQSVDKVKALELNKKAIEKFSDASKADTSFADPTFFNSECSMYAKDFKNCIYWTSRLMRLDTSQKNLVFCGDRIKYCNEHLLSK